MPLHVSSTCRCDDTRGCVMQFWPPDDEHTCSQHVEAWNKLIVKQKFCASSWLITEINILRCTASKTSKDFHTVLHKLIEQYRWHNYAFHTTMPVKLEAEHVWHNECNVFLTARVKCYWQKQGISTMTVPSGLSGKYQLFFLNVWWTKKICKIVCTNREMNITCEQHIWTKPMKRSAKDNPLHTKDKIMKTREMTEDKQSWITYLWALLT